MESYYDGAPSGRGPSPWLCTGSTRLCARKCSVPPRRRGGDVQGASGRIDSWLNTARRRCMAAPAGRLVVIPSHHMEDYCAQKTAHLAQNLEVY
jgi:hypothetical protein